MNNSEKIDLINKVLVARSLDFCPFCYTKLENRVNKKGKKQNHCDRGGYIIRDVDYIEIIEGIVKYSILKENKKKFKSLSEF